MAIQLEHYGYEANNIIISGNNITGNTGTGINITGESFFIMGNNISNNRYGITLESSKALFHMTMFLGMNITVLESVLAKT